MRIHIKTYGCQMNEYDSQLMAAIIQDEGFELVDQPVDADAILLNGCAVRENAEAKVLQHLAQYAPEKKKNPALIIGVTGCMGAHLGDAIRSLRPNVDFVIGPDAYRSLPALLRREDVPEEALRRCDESYDEIIPQRRSGISGWVAITRGCNEECAYCVVPKTRGVERSRPVDSLVREIEQMVDQGYVEATLLGQNVNNYRYGDHDFAALVDRLGRVPGLKRLRYATSHPMNMSERLLQVMAGQDTICQHIHLPVQSGSDRVLERMRRRYTRDAYIRLVDMARSYMPDVTITSDIISGFCGETEADHERTLELVQRVQFDSAFTFRYSPREGTEAWDLPDDVPDDIKLRRLQELSDLQRSISTEKYAAWIGRSVEILIEGPSRRSEQDCVGRTSGNVKVIVPETQAAPGTLLNVTIAGATSQTFTAECPVAAACV